jgi:HEAT repeat protein
MAHEPAVAAQVRETLKATALDSNNDIELRGQAVYWLSETPGQDTLAFLEELVNSRIDPELQRQAVFAISQHEPAQSLPLLESVVLNESYDVDTRAQALHWIGEEGGAEALPFLTRAYAELAEPDLKQQTLHAVSETGAAGATAWLVARAGDPAEPIDLRQQALFFASEGGLPVGDLKAIYERTAEPDLREYVVWLISERGGEESLQAMLEIARTDPDPAMRERAISLIGTSEDPRAEEFLLQILGE